MNKKLILELGDNRDSISNLPQQYFFAKQRWCCDVVTETSNGVVDEYAITPDRKLFLREFLQIIQDEIKKLTADNTSEWGVKIYRMINKK